MAARSVVLRTVAQLSLIAGLAPCLLTPGCREAAGDTALPPVRRAACRRGELVRRAVLTGVLEPAHATVLSVPQTPEWRATVSWFAEDGSLVHAGDRVAELDSSTFVSTMADRRLEAVKTELALRRAKAAAEASELKARLDLAKAENKLAVARLDAGVPEQLLSRRELDARRLALAKAEAAVKTAQAALVAAAREGQADIEVARLAHRRAEEQVAVAEKALQEMVLRAPRDGIAVISDHPWQGRKLQVGDVLFVGAALAEVADPTDLRVRAELWSVDDGLVGPGMPVECRPDISPGRVLRGAVATVTQVARAPEEGSLRRAFDVVVKLAPYDPKGLRPGMSVRIDVEVERLPDVLLVPRWALDAAGVAPRVRFADGRWQSVRLGPCTPLECAVTGGLEAGAELAPAAGGH